MLITHETLNHGCAIYCMSNRAKASKMGLSSPTVRYLRYLLGSLSAKLGLAAIISEVSVADKAKSDDFDL